MMAKISCAHCINRGVSGVTIKPSRKFLRHGNVSVSSANDLARQRLTRTAYPPPRVACVRGAARATVDKTCSARDRVYPVKIDAVIWNQNAASAVTCI